LLRGEARGEFLTGVDHGNVVETEKPAFKDIVALTIDLVHPPGKIKQQFVEAAFEKQAVRLAGANTVHVIHPPHGPGLHGRVEIGKLPFVGWNLATGMLELLEHEEPELLFGELRIDYGESHS